MKPGPSSTPPDLMALFSVLSWMMCVAPVQMGMKLLLIATMVPELGWLVKRWMESEERCEEGWLWERTAHRDDDDPLAALEGPDGELRSGWISQIGSIWIWLNVSKAGLITCPVVVFSKMHNNLTMPQALLWSPRWVLSAFFSSHFFKPVLASSQTCALFVPVTQ